MLAAEILLTSTRGKYCWYKDGDLRLLVILIPIVKWYTDRQAYKSPEHILIEFPRVREDECLPHPPSSPDLLKLVT